MFGTAFVLAMALADAPRNDEPSQSSIIQNESYTWPSRVELSVARTLKVAFRMRCLLWATLSTMTCINTATSHRNESSSENYLATVQLGQSRAVRSSD